jgi:hypothetical protein
MGNSVMLQYLIKTITQLGKNKQVLHKTRADFRDHERMKKDTRNRVKSIVDKSPFG